MPLAKKLSPTDGPVVKFSWWHFPEYWLTCKDPAYCERCHCWAGGPEGIRKQGWTRHEEWSGKPCSSTTSDLVSAFRFLPWIPALASLRHGLWCDSLNLFFLKLFLVMVLITPTESKLGLLFSEIGGDSLPLTWLCMYFSLELSHRGTDPLATCSCSNEESSEHSVQPGSFRDCC